MEKYKDLLQIWRKKWIK